MKTTKRIFAMVMAVMLIVALVPFTVSAATPDASFKVKCDTEGFEFEIYQVATVDTETGLYTAVATDDDIKAAVNGSEQNLLTVCNAATSGWGEKVATYTSGAEATVNGKAGVFYIRNTKKPATVKSVSNSIVCAPKYDEETDKWVDLTEVVDISGKVATGDVSVSKAIDGTDNLYKTAAVGDIVTFKLTASVVGSAAEKLQAYTIKDTHVEALEFQEVTKVEVVGGDEEVADYEIKEDYEVVNKTATGFDVTLKAAALDNDDFYSKANVVVTYKAKLTDKAEIGNPGNKNHDALTWTAADGTDGNADGNDVFVYTFKIVINKKEQGTDKALDGVKFQVYSDANCTTKVGDELTTANGGVAELKGVDAGTYYVKETKTIEGYNLNTKVYEVKIEPTFTNTAALATVTDGTVSVTVYNTKSKLPQTGIEGTMAFTFVGAGLILLAGALFVVAMKKKSVK